jgi:DNA-binding NarL/FixJ family response regulator
VTVVELTDSHGTSVISPQSAKPGSTSDEALFDRQVGVLALGPAGAAIVRASPVLDALGALFDGIWIRAVPLKSTVDSDLDDRSRQVLRLMSDGFKDESIARALGLSRRTVQKCMTTVMTALGARTGSRRLCWPGSGAGWTNDRARPPSRAWPVRDQWNLLGN